LQLVTRQQLLAATALVSVALTGLSAANANGVEVESRFTIFREPSKLSKNAGITVYHPQTDVRATLGDAFSIGANYEIDMVSGATQRVQSAAVDAISSATKFDDFRQAAGGSLGWNMTDIGLSAGYSHGWEKDYKSNTILAAARGDFMERNLTLGLAYTKNLDEVCDNNNATAQDIIDLKPLASSDHCFDSKRSDVVTRKVGIDTFEPSLAWTVTPKLLMQFGGTLQVIKGFQSSPYRRVAIGPQGNTPQERLPEARQRYALFSRAHFAIPSIRGAVLLGGRAYWDTWELWAASADLTFRKYLADALVLSVNGRYHRQTGANFYRNGMGYLTEGSAGAYWTGDRELSPMGAMTGGFKLAYFKRKEQNPAAFFDEIEVNLKFEGIFYQLESGAPNRDRTMALVAQVGFALRF